MKNSSDPVFWGLKSAIKKHTAKVTNNRIAFGFSFFDKDAILTSLKGNDQTKKVPIIAAGSNIFMLLYAEKSRLMDGIHSVIHKNESSINKWNDTDSMNMAIKPIKGMINSLWLVSGFCTMEKNNSTKNKILQK